MKSIDFVVARELTMIIGLGSALYATYSVGYMSGWEAYFATRNNEPLLHAPWLHTVNTLRIIISAAFIVSSFSLRSRNVTGLLLSTIAILAVAICYAWWYHYSVETLRSLEISDFSQANFGRPFHYAGGLREAIWWDIAVFTLTSALLLWKAILVLKALRINPGSSASS